MDSMNLGWTISVKRFMTIFLGRFPRRIIANPVGTGRFVDYAS